MESTFDRATKIASTQLTKMRWALGLNGLLSVAVGVVILVWPGISLYALTILFGAYALATGVVGSSPRSAAPRRTSGLARRLEPARHRRRRRSCSSGRTSRRSRCST
jgi:hypothetical protein